MAQKRMFSRQIIDSDSFVDMPLSSQALYLHLAMRADDEGFINNPKNIQRLIGASLDDLRLLIAKNFIIPFDSGIVVIKHWRIHNYIQSDRFHPTSYTEERSQLELKNNLSYSLKSNMDTECIQDVYKLDTQIRLDKNRLDLDKNSIDKEKEVKEREITFLDTENAEVVDTTTKPKTKRFVPPTLEEVHQYCIERCNNIDPQAFIDFYQSKGWCVGRDKMKDWKAAVRNWENREKKDRANKPNSGGKNSFYSSIDDWSNNNG